MSNSIYTATQTAEGREQFSHDLAEATAKMLATLKAEREAGNYKPATFSNKDRFANSNFGNGF